tara:strand:+ start:344 stop:913 length:570 start_codon:yes stop_codon:yes gene_type:complete
MISRAFKFFGANKLGLLQERVLRLEAKEAVLSAFNRYLYCLDTGFGNEIVDCFTEDAILDVPNFPNAGGNDLHFEGRKEIAPLYAPYGDREPGIGGGHHSANIAINVRLDLLTAEVTSYFMTGSTSAIQGGRYEGIMRRSEDTWRWEKLTITSAWGWRVKEYETISEPVSLKFSPFGGRHAVYEHFSQS